MKSVRMMWNRGQVKVVLLVCALALSPFVSATPDPQGARDAVYQTMSNLIELMRTTELPAEEAEAFGVIHDLLGENLEAVVDFKLISKRIMGKHFAKANKEQRNNFLAAFQDSLVNVYGKTLLETDDLASMAEKIDFQVLPVNEKLTNRVPVKIILRVDGSSHELEFKMYYNNSKSGWFLENMVVEGVNLGINYRTQFDRLMSQFNGNYDDVIAYWKSDTERKKKESQEG